MSIKTKQKIGFFTSLAMLLGTVIGIGIFLKNHSVLRANDWSGVGTLVSWIFGGILSLGAAVSFSEISSFKTKIVDGPPGWAEKVGGKYFGYFTRFNYGIFYFIILNITIAFFAAETLIGIFTPSGKYHLGIIAALAMGLLLLFVTTNYVSIKSAGVIQKISTVIKFIPLIAVIFGGIAMATTNLIKYTVETPSYTMKLGQSAFNNGQSFDFTKMLAALPAVLFAYDSFLVTTQLRHKMKKPKKLPFIVLIGMILVIVLYSLIAISAILHGSGVLSSKFIGVQGKFKGLGIFDQIMGAKAANIVGDFMLVFICISTLGVLNGISAGTVAMIEQNIATNTLFGSKYLKNKLKAKVVPVILVILFVIGFLIVGIPAIVLNSDGYIDAISNFPTLFMFAIYGIIILLYTIKRKKQKTIKINNILFNIMAYIAIIGIFFIIAYQVFYGMTTNLFMHLGKDSNAGLFATHDKVFINLKMVTLFFVMFIMFFALPAINYLLIKYIEKRNPIEAIESKIETKKFTK